MGAAVFTPTLSESRGQYLHAPKDLRLETRDLVPPGPNEVQISLRATTLCGSDLHYYAHGRNGAIIAREPLCLGHEASGVVVSVGSEVQIPTVGDKVAIECGVPCETCELCREARYNLCPNLRFRSSGSAFPHFQGTLQDTINHPAKWVHRLPMSMGFEEGALLEPLAVAIQSVRRAKMRRGSNCLVFGAGAVGLLCAFAARMLGCGNIIIADIDAGRVQFALEAGFASSVVTLEAQRPQNIEEKLLYAKHVSVKIGEAQWPDKTSVGKVDVTFECTGVETCLQGSIYSTKAGGTVVIVGMGTANHTLPISDASAREIDLVPSWRYANCYATAIDMMSKSDEDKSLPDVKRMITHVFEGLESVPKAFEMAGKTRDADGKLIIKTVINNDRIDK